MKSDRIATAIFCSALLLAGCNSLPPLSDQLTLVPAASKTDATPGLDLTYLYGTNQGVLNQVSCDQTQHCWLSGVLGKIQTSGNRINSLVIRTLGTSRVAWAHTYEIGDSYTGTIGLVPTPDGSALLYGNTLISHFSGEQAKAVYEKLDAAGNPQWGGTLLVGGMEPWSAFSDAIRLRDGGYLFVGSGYIQKPYWYGVLLKIDASGTMAWAESVHSRDESTFLTRILQLADGNILAAGYNAKLRDIVLFRFSLSGKLLGSTLLDIRGFEVPIGLVRIPDGVDMVAYQKMPSGEEAAIVLNLDKNGKLQDAARYHYVDGFNPNSVVALSPHSLCLYGYATAKDKPQSIAIALDAKRRPVSALVMKGDSAFNSAALYKPGTIVFAGNRKLGTDQRTTPLITRWTPSVKNDPQALKKVRRDGLHISAHNHADATISPWDAPKWERLKPEDLPFRSIYGTPAPSKPH